MLGKLAKYLRLMGYDTYYSNKSLADDEILEIAKKENRILITRDRDLASRYGKSYLLNSTDTIDQLKEIVKAFNLNTKRMMTRCSICNVELIKINKASVKGKVPEKVYGNFEDLIRRREYHTGARNDIQLLLYPRYATLAYLPPMEIPSRVHPAFFFSRERNLQGSFSFRLPPPLHLPLLNPGTGVKVFHILGIS